MSNSLKLSLLLWIAPFWSSHAQEYLNHFKEASYILAQQFQEKGQTLRAMTMLSFCLELDDNNEQAKDFISVINVQQKFRLYKKIPDEGRQFSTLINNVISINQNLPRERTNYWKFVAKILNHDSPNHEIEDIEKQFNTFQKYFPDYTPSASEKAEILNPFIEASLSKKLAGKKPFEIAKTVKLYDLKYNPRKLLDFINSVNKALQPYATFIDIRTELLPHRKEVLNDGRKIYIGEELDIESRTIRFTNVTIYETLKFIEHTLALTFQEQGELIILREGLRGQNGRPTEFQVASKLMKEIKQSTTKAKAKYHMKSIQLKGAITQLKAESSRLLVEIDNHFVVEIDNRLLKGDTLQLMKDYLMEQKSNPYSAAKMLNVSLRGYIKIRTITRTDIIKCNSIIAEGAPHFYLKH